MTPLALWAYEIRRAGWAALLTPPVTAALVALVALLQTGTGADDVMTARTLQAVLEMGMPLAAGVGAASLVGHDAAVELQVSTYRSYRATLLRRLTVTLGWAGMVAVLTSVVLTATGWWHRWPLAHDPVPGQLTWLSPTLCLAGLGFLLAALTREPAAAGAMIAAAWLGQQLAGNLLLGHSWTQPLFLFATTRGSAETDWLTNRLALLAAGAVLVGAGWLVLSRTERLLRGADA